MDLRREEEPILRPPCDHDFSYSAYYEILQESYVAKRECSECGRVQRKVMNTEDSRVEELTEDQIEEFFYRY